MAEYPVEAIALACKGELHAGAGGSIIRHLITDSRKFSFPGESIFVAIEGERHDGHKYIIDMYRQHIRNFIVSRLPQNIENFPSANFVVVNDTLLALQQVASMHRDNFTLPVIGITGSNGKTTVKEWLFQLLSKELVIVRSPRSYNSQTGVPLSVWQLSAHHELAVFEAGISRPGEMGRLEPVIKPQIGLITNIGEAHQAGFDDLEHKLSEKLLLFKNTGVIVYCSDHEIIDNYLKNKFINEKIRLFTWSVSKDANLKIISMQRKTNSTVIHGHYNGSSGRLTVPFTDQASVENAVHAWAILLLLGYSHEFIASGIQELSPLAMRMEQKKGINNCTIINDSYNSDRGSLGIAVDFLMQQTQHKAKTLVLSDMFETGRGRSELYKDIAELLNREKINRFIGIGTGVKEIRDWYKGRSEFFDTTGDFLKSLDPVSFSDEAILLKGSRNFEFERISVLLEEKTHATVMEVNLNNLVDNYNYFKARLNPGTKIMAVVKAFSYGSGSYEIANILAYNLVDYLAVAFSDEGISLRNAGIKVPIIVMNPDFSSYPLMIDHSLEPEIYNLSGLRNFIEKLNARHLKDYPIHIKLDTGMNRLGFSSGQADELARMLRENNSVRVKSVFSHLAASDDPAHDDFTRLQVSRFVQMSDALVSRLDYPVLKHILNSAGIERFPEHQFDMVRLGIGMYGISSLKNNRLSNVNTFRSIISLIREVPAGESIGYSRAFRTAVNSKIAIVPVGYADGLDRRLGNGAGRMIVKEVFAPIVGNICMDMCMLDITGIEAREGDEVIVFGDNHSISDIADSLSTIPYEVFTKISARVKRIYVQE
jgi:Alr-MurF fusion protein